MIRNFRFSELATYPQENPYFAEVILAIYYPPLAMILIYFSFIYNYHETNHKSGIKFAWYYMQSLQTAVIQYYDIFYLCHVPTFCNFH
jgi:hypothetical protein